MLRNPLFRRTFILTLTLFISGMLAITAYALWRLRTEAVGRGLETSVMHSQRVEDLLTQNLHVTELIAATTLAQAPGLKDSIQIVNSFEATLGRSPFLRSMSLLDENGRIITSSNPSNVGVLIATENFLPQAKRSAEILRIGHLWSGRDFSSGRRVSPQLPADPEAPSFIPVLQTLVSGERTLRLLVAFNTDYFVNRITQNFDDKEGAIEVLLYDGARLISSVPEAQLDVMKTDIWRDLNVSEIESGHFEQTFADGRSTLSSFRASRLYPLVVVTHVDLDYALRHWKSEAITLLACMLLILLGVSLLAFVYYRHQLHLSAQRDENARIQRINATVFDSSNEAILITDINAIIVSINQAFTQITGYAQDEIMGQNLLALLTQEGRALFSQCIEHPETRQNQSAGIEAQLVCKAGHLIWTEILSTPERSSTGEFVGYHRVCRNISERKSLENEIRTLAFIDPLTQLPNRRLFNDRLGQTVLASKRSGNYGALMFMDLDNFKTLNDTQGHAVGDMLLIEVAKRLKSSVRETDVVGRYGGDEFVVVLGALKADKDTSTSLAGIIAEKIRAALIMPYQLSVSREGLPDESIEHRCSASIGVVMFMGQKVSQEDLLVRADEAMYQAKESGRNTIRFYVESA